MMVEGSRTVESEGRYCMLLMKVLEIVRAGGSGLGQGLLRGFSEDDAVADVELVACVTGGGREGGG